MSESNMVYMGWYSKKAAELYGANKFKGLGADKEVWVTEIVSVGSKPSSQFQDLKNVGLLDASIALEKSDGSLMIPDPIFLNKVTPLI